MCEAWALAVKIGLDPATLHEAIKGGWAGSRVMEETIPRLLTRNFVPGGTVDIMTKDVGYALNMARTANVPVPVTALAHELFRMVKAQGKGGRGPTDPDHPVGAMARDHRRRGEKLADGEVTTDFTDDTDYARESSPVKSAQSV